MARQSRTWVYRCFWILAFNLLLGLPFYQKTKGGQQTSVLVFTDIFSLCFFFYILGSMFLTMLSPEMVQEIIEFQEIADPKNPDMEMFWDFYERMFKALAIPYAAAYLVVGAAMAFLINKNLPSDLD